MFYAISRKRWPKSRDLYAGILNSKRLKPCIDWVFDNLNSEHALINFQSCEQFPCQNSLIVAFQISLDGSGFWMSMTVFHKRSSSTSWPDVPCAPARDRRPPTPTPHPYHYNKVAAIPPDPPYLCNSPYRSNYRNSALVLFIGHYKNDILSAKSAETLKRCALCVCRSKSSLQ